MKAHWTILFSAILLASCNNEKEEEESKGKAVAIQGSIQGGAGQIIYLSMVNESGIEEVVTSDTLDNDGSFKLQVTDPQLNLYGVAITEPGSPPIPHRFKVYASPNETVRISGSFPDFWQNRKITGNRHTELLQEFIERRDKFMREIQTILYQRVPTGDTALINKMRAENAEKISKLESEFSAYCLDFVKKNKNSPACIPALSYFGPSGSIKDWDRSNLELFEEVADALEVSFPGNPATQDVKRQLGNLENRLLTLDPACAEVDCRAPNFKAPGLDGDIRSLADMKGKVVLIDFWASWCSPCRKVNPDVVAMYEKYKDKGFDIMSVSLDENTERWKEAIEQDNLSWENHVCDTRGWYSPIVQLYSVKAIPYTVLLDREGRIVATKLKGKALEAKVAAMVNQ